MKFFFIGAFLFVLSSQVFATQSYCMNEYVGMGKEGLISQTMSEAIYNLAKNELDTRGLQALDYRASFDPNLKTMISGQHVSVESNKSIIYVKNGSDLIPLAYKVRFTWLEIKDISITLDQFGRIAKNSICKITLNLDNLYPLKIDLYNPITGHEISSLENYNFESSVKF